MQLRAAAVDAHRRAADGVDRERYDLLLELATDAAYAGRWTQVEAAAIEATALGRALGSAALVGAAASTLTRYCVWVPHEAGVVLEDVIDDLRWALAHTADDDLATRCRLQLTLAVELYYAEDASAERRALVETGVAMARRDRRPGADLVGDADRAGWRAGRRPTWWSGWAGSRRDWPPRARPATWPPRPCCSPPWPSTSWSWAASTAGRSSVRAAVAIARRERLPYVMFTVHWVRMTLAAMRGDRAAVAEQLAGLADQLARGRACRWPRCTRPRRR